MEKSELHKEWRKTSQNLLPPEKPGASAGNYDIYPSFGMGEGQISEGFESLADTLSKHTLIMLDGYGGVFYDQFREELDGKLKDLGLKATWISTSAFLKSEERIDELISPFMGGDDPLFGKRADLEVEDFFDLQKLRNLSPDPMPIST